MACPYCQGDATQELDRVTALGYQLYRCRPCRRTFNERTSTCHGSHGRPTQRPEVDAAMPPADNRGAGRLRRG